MGEANSPPKMTKFVMTSHEGVSLRYRLEAEEAYILKENEKVKVIKPNLDIFEKGPGAKLLVQAEGEKGEIRLDTKDVLLEENVHYRVIAKQHHLTTSKLYYWYQRGETEVPPGTGYVLETPSGRAQGLSMIAKEDLTK